MGDGRLYVFVIMEEWESKTVFDDYRMFKRNDKYVIWRVTAQRLDRELYYILGDRKYREGCLWRIVDARYDPAAVSNLNLSA